MTHPGLVARLVGKSYLSSGSARRYLTISSIMCQHHTQKGQPWSQDRRGQGCATSMPRPVKILPGRASPWQGIVAESQGMEYNLGPSITPSTAARELIGLAHANGAQICLKQPIRSRLHPLSSLDLPGHLAVAWRTLCAWSDLPTGRFFHQKRGLVGWRALS